MPDQRDPLVALEAYKKRTEPDRNEERALGCCRIEVEGPIRAKQNPSTRKKNRCV